MATYRAPSRRRVSGALAGTRDKWLGTHDGIGSRRLGGAYEASGQNQAARRRHCQRRENYIATRNNSWLERHIGDSALITALTIASGEASCGWH